VRAAWRRIAAATHPDRDDGGEPGRFSAAAAAYDTLRTSFGRGEALADLGLAVAAPRVARHATHRAAHRAANRAANRGARHARRTGAAGRGVAGRARRGGAAVLGVGVGVSGRGWRLALRACVAGGVTAVALLAAGWTPATIGVLAGALTWLAVTSRAVLRGRGNGLPGRLCRGRNAYAPDCVPLLAVISI